MDIVRVAMGVEGHSQAGTTLEKGHKPPEDGRSVGWEGPLHSHLHS